MSHFPDTLWAWPLSAVPRDRLVLRAPSFHLQKTTLVQQVHYDSPNLSLIFRVWGYQHRLRFCQQRRALRVCPGPVLKYPSH